MWFFPLTAAVVAFVFAGQMGRVYLAKRKPFHLLWMVALAMYGIASVAVAWCVVQTWSEAWFSLYWGFGAVLTVAFLAGGELVLLFPGRGVRIGVYAALAVVTVWTAVTLQGAHMSAAVLAGNTLPSGKNVFGAGTAAHRLPQYISYPSYFILLGGSVWSALKMRARPELKDRFMGTLLIAVGATIQAGFGSAFAALGKMAPFSVALTVGILVMFLGFLRASKPTKTPEPAEPSAG